MLVLPVSTEKVPHLVYITGVMMWFLKIIVLFLQFLAGQGVPIVSCDLVTVLLLLLLRCLSALLQALP